MCILHDYNDVSNSTNTTTTTTTTTNTNNTNTNTNNNILTLKYRCARLESLQWAWK